MDDLQRPPGDNDRAQIVARINRVHDQGRISTADRDIRLGNVKSAQSMAELDLMTRDLDQLEATLTPTAEQPWSAFNPQQPSGLPASGAGVQRFAVIIAVIVALALVGGVVVAVIANRVADSRSGESSGSPGSPGGSDSGEPGGQDDRGEPADPAKALDGPSYSLTARGVRDFLAAYRQKFGTSKVVGLTFYQDYVIVYVPVRGGARQSGWLLRAKKWQDFGGTRASFPGTVTVDTRGLNVDAMIRNIARARRVLNVEPPAQAYALIDYRPPSDRVPNVDIHIANEFQESGYLATTLQGKVERTYPYSR